MSLTVVTCQWRFNTDNHTKIVCFSLIFSLGEAAQWNELSTNLIGHVSSDELQASGLRSGDCGFWRQGCHPTGLLRRVKYSNRHLIKPFLAQFKTKINFLSVSPLP